MRRRIAAALLSAALAAPVLLQASPARAEADLESVPTADVVFNGKPLFRVCGISATPAERRAEAIAARLEAVAGDPTVLPASLRIEEKEGTTDILAGDRFLMSLTDADARAGGAGRSALAAAYVRILREEIAAYRADREAGRLLRGGLWALLATVLFVMVLLVLRWTFRRLEAWLGRRYHDRVKTLQFHSFTILQAEQAWSAILRGVGGIRIAAYVVAGYLWAHFVMSQFPWTRPSARNLLDYLLSPVFTLGRSFLAYLPKLAFLVVLVLVTRYLLRIGRLFFRSVEVGTVTFQGFDPDWAMPTFKLLRVAVIAFALVVAYPYLPGSDSMALKGVSLFFGLMVSLGSTSAISNVIAGYSLTYRRAFKIGDIVRIGEHMGAVVETRLLVTHLRTVKNEEIVIPNSQILGGAVVNYSSLAKKQGLILHTSVGIGYETPWRQVEAMLLLAAARTGGISQDPPPFVLHRALADFAVTYELNVYTASPSTMLRTYTELHRNILDVFNEYGVQIMTPAYEGDPEKAKVVPRGDWYLAPAEPPGEGGAPGTA